MDTNHAAHWSDLSYSSSEEEENRYTPPITTCWSQPPHLHSFNLSKTAVVVFVSSCCQWLLRGDKSERAWLIWLRNNNELLENIYSASLWVDKVYYNNEYTFEDWNHILEPKIWFHKKLLKVIMNYVRMMKRLWVCRDHAAWKQVVSCIIKTHAHRWELICLLRWE
jgi:hypothetical protein